MYYPKRQLPLALASSDGCELLSPAYEINTVSRFGGCGGAVFYEDLLIAPHVEWGYVEAFKRIRKLLRRQVADKGVEKPDRNSDFGCMPEANDRIQ